MTKERSARVFAWYSIAIAVLHFTGETAYHVRYGQPLPSLIVDYIAVSLLLLGDSSAAEPRAATD